MDDEILDFVFTCKEMEFIFLYKILQENGIRLAAMHYKMLGFHVEILLVKSFILPRSCVSN